MADLVLRLVKGSPLTNSEVDNNFSNLNITKVEIGGDLSGTYSVPIVARIQTRNIANIVPSSGQALIWNSTTSAWTPGNVSATGGGASVTISDTAPGSPTAGDLWWSSATATLYIYYNDGSSSQWVEASGGGGGSSLPTGGSLGQVLTKNSSTDYDASWQTPTATSGGETIHPFLLAGM
jgi:hypothetical protein